MASQIQELRKIVLKLDASGTAIPIDNTKLYKGCYNFVGLQVYVPVTQNRDAGTTPQCTVHAVTIDAEGVRTRVRIADHNMPYVAEVTVGRFKYLLFERKMPKPFTDTAGDLEFGFDYREITLGDPPLLVASLPTNIYYTTVEESGASDAPIELDLTASEAAQINENTINIAILQDTVDGFDDRIRATEEEIESLKSLGHYVGTFDNYATAQADGNTTVPLNKSAFPKGITPGDYVDVRVDETHDNYTTAYRALSIDINGDITWEHFRTYTTDISGKMDVRLNAAADNFVSFDGGGNSKDSGYSGADIEAAQETADEAKQIALGRNNNKVFDTNRLDNLTI